MPEEVEAIMDIIQKYPEIIKEIIEEMMPGSEDEEDMEYPKDEEDMEYPKDKEEMGTEQNSTAWRKRRRDRKKGNWRRL